MELRVMTLVGEEKITRTIPTNEHVYHGNNMRDYLSEKINEIFKPFLISLDASIAMAPPPESYEKIKSDFEHVRKRARIESSGDEEENNSDSE